MTFRALVSMRAGGCGARGEQADYLAADLTAWLASRGGATMAVPNTLPEPGRLIRDAGADLLVLTGGNNLGPLAGERLEWEDVSLERDRTETALLEAAVAAGVPVLGICRGIQAVNVYFGGAMTRDVSVAGAGSHAGTTHALAIKSPGLSVRLGRDSLETNSYHCQGVHLADVAPGLAVFATAGGGVVEGVCHETLPVLAVQWHPERPGSCTLLDDLVMRALTGRESLELFRLGRAMEE